MFLFGTVKLQHAVHYVLGKGIEKVPANLELSFLVYNLRRAINNGMKMDEIGMWIVMLNI